MYAQPQQQQYAQPQQQQYVTSGVTQQVHQVTGDNYWNTQAPTGVPQQQVITTGQTQWPAEAQTTVGQQQPAGAYTGQVRTINLGAGQAHIAQPQQTRTIAAGGSSLRVEHDLTPVQYRQTQGAVRDIPLDQSTKVERLEVNPESYVNHMGSRGTQQMKMDKQEIMMTEHEIVMPQETVVHPQAVHIEEEEVVLQPETHLSPREVIVQPYTSVQPQEVIVRPQVIVAKPRTVIKPEEVIVTPHTVIQPKGITIRPQDIVVADEEIVVHTGKTTVHDLGCDVYKQDQDVEEHGARGFNVSYNHQIPENAGNTRAVHNMGVNTVRNLKFEGYQSFVQNEQPASRAINLNSAPVVQQQQQQVIMTDAAPTLTQYVYSNGQPLAEGVRYF